EERRKQRPGLTDVVLDDELAQEYGYYEIPSQPVTDYKTQFFTLPGGLFRSAVQTSEERDAELKERYKDDPARPERLQKADAEREAELKLRAERKVPLTIRVVCDSPTQYVGMARYDLYGRLDEPGRGEQWLFMLNFFKGAFGLWLLLALVIGLAVVLSTYLN